MSAVLFDHLQKGTAPAFARAIGRRKKRPALGQSFTLYSKTSFLIIK
jgi:hypothetical protein